MRIRGMEWAAVMGGVLLSLSGCGDHNNFLGGLADDHSLDAKLEEAQIALDKGDCQTAIDGFTAGFNDDPNNVGIRVNLAAAYTCRAGFNVTELIRVGAKFASSTQTADQFKLFKTIADAAVQLVSATWDADTTTAIGFLTDKTLPPTGGCKLAPFANNPDAAFNEAIIETIRAVMAVTELKNAAGVILTGSITDAVAKPIGSALVDADQGIACADSIVGGNVVVDTDVAKAIHDLNVGVNDLDCPSGAPADAACHTNDLSGAELQQFLSTQGYTLQ
ncbi:MAG: hypothetical protein HY283_01945 [Nitrospirae bacterium]|nr:hypothetical protein [Nitrospirota bacterium]